MHDMDDWRTVMLLTILQEPNANKARMRYCEVFEIDEIKDQAIYDYIEDHVLDAIMRNDSMVDIEIEWARPMLLLLKNGIKRSKGGQPIGRHRERRKRAAISFARKRKAELIEEGMSATEAHAQAAEEAAKTVNRKGHEYEAEYLAREMERAEG